MTSIKSEYVRHSRERYNTQGIVRQMVCEYSAEAFVFDPGKEFTISGYYINLSPDSSHFILAIASTGRAEMVRGMRKDIENALESSFPFDVVTLTYMNINGEVIGVLCETESHLWFRPLLLTHAEADLVQQVPEDKKQWVIIPKSGANKTDLADKVEELLWPK